MERSISIDLGWATLGLCSEEEYNYIKSENSMFNIYTISDEQGDSEIEEEKEIYDTSSSNNLNSGSCNANVYICITFTKTGSSDNETLLTNSCVTKATDASERFSRSIEILCTENYSSANSFFTKEKILYLFG